jgi:hypothetical protein
MGSESAVVERAKKAKDAASAKLRRYPNVVGVGVGYKIVGGERTSTVAVRVYVERKVPEKELSPNEVVPKELETIPTDVIEDRFRIHQDDDHRRWRALLLGGISIGNAITGGSGTLGTTVFDAKTGEQLLLSNWHVLCGRSECAFGETIIQPGTGGGDTGDAGDVVAQLVRTSLTDVVDCGVARITGHRLLFEEILGVGMARGHTPAMLGETARKSGRTTGVTVATVADIDASVDIDYSELGMGTRHFEHQVVLEGDDASRPGDSGSAWLNGANEMIALNFAGGDSGRRATANPVTAVVDALQIVIAPGVPLQGFLAQTA